MHATKLCLAGFPVAGSLLSQEAMTGFLQLATKMAMNGAARTAERRPRRVPLSRLTGARPHRGGDPAAGRPARAIRQ